MHCSCGLIQLQLVLLPTRKCVCTIGIKPCNSVLPAGFRSTRKTKIVCTIGPASCSYESLSLLAENGMNVARLNMTHSNRQWHETVVENIRRLNKERG